MVLVDTSVWLALSLSSHPFHAMGLDWLAQQTGEASVLFCRATQQSFLRLLTTQSVVRPFGITLTNAAAWSVYVASQKLWMDAYLAAFAVAGGVELVTTDKAFKQFEGLRVTVLARA